MPLSLQMAMLNPILAGETNSQGVQALEVCPIFQNHAVVQRDAPLPIWGWAAPGETVTVQLAGQKRETEADKDGYWKVLFQPIRTDDCKLSTDGRLR